jgi:hypothetical protein
MRPSHALLLVVVVTWGAQGAEPVALGLSPLPPELRGAAAVVRFNEKGAPEVLRAGKNGLVCFRVEPGEEELDVRCYHETFMPIIYEGRLAQAKGLKGPALRQAVDEAVKSGRIKLPPRPTVSYRVLAKAGQYDAATGEVDPAAEAWQAVHIPYASAAEMGAVDEDAIAEQRKKNTPYAMAAGTFWAHIMVEHAAAK